MCNFLIWNSYKIVKESCWKPGDITKYVEIREPLVIKNLRQENFQEPKKSQTSIFRTLKSFRVRIHPKQFPSYPRLRRDNLMKHFKSKDELQKTQLIQFQNTQLTQFQNTHN